MLKQSIQSIAYCILFMGVAQHAHAADAGNKDPVVVIETNMGLIEVQLNAKKAPISVENFLGYVDEEFYDNTVFHRVIRGFMVQGGGYTTDYRQKKTFAPIKNEATNGLSNERGTIAMARSGVVDSATAQFFINTVNNRRLDHQSRSQRGYGYAVFGKVISGMDVVDRIERTPTGACPHFPRDCPRTQIKIIKVRRKALGAPGAPAKTKASSKSGPLKKTQGIRPYPAKTKKSAN